jgi:ribosomal protein S18 acetylase RimI-like enzyme
VTGVDSVRIAKTTDLEAVNSVDHIASAGDEDRISMLVRRVESDCCLVYTHLDRVAGFVVFSPRCFFGHDFVELIVVAPHVRRSGIGRTLLRAAANACGTDQVFTSTNQSNDPMCALLSSERWYFSGQLDGLDVDDPELVFFTIRRGIRCE